MADTPVATRYCYSFDEEQFHGDFGTEQEAVAEAAASDPERTTVYVGEVRPVRKMLVPQHLGDDIIDRVSELLFEEMGEFADDFSASAEQKQELGAMVIEWLDENVGFAGYGVENVKETTINTDD